MTYTPDTYTVRQVYADYWTDHPIPTNHPLREQQRAEFDVWLASVKAEAWDEGADFQYDRLSDERATNDSARNPYRAED